MDILYIDQLTVMAWIGIYDWERKCLQKLVFDLQLNYNNQIILNNIITIPYLDYTQVNQVILNTVEKKHFLLIEHVAEIVSKKLIEQFFVISWVHIKVSKPDAIRNAHNVGICIERRRSDYFEKLKLYIGS